MTLYCLLADTAFFLTREVLSGFLVEDPHEAKLNPGFVAAVLVGSR
jgi:hypothetical protein